MHKNHLALALIAAGALVGCGSGGSGSATLPAENHGGVLVPLSDKEAYVELLNGERKKNGARFDTTIIAYLLQPDLKSAFAEKPTSVQVKIGADKGDQVVDLKAAPDSADPVGSGRFESAYGPFDLHQAGGEVTVQVGGKTLSGPFRGPR
jgi:hypothetical protein